MDHPSLGGSLACSPMHDTCSQRAFCAVHGALPCAERVPRPTAGRPAMLWCCSQASGRTGPGTQHSSAGWLSGRTPPAGCARARPCTPSSPAGFAESCPARRSTHALRSGPAAAHQQCGFCSSTYRPGFAGAEERTTGSPRRSGALRPARQLLYAKPTPSATSASTNGTAPDCCLRSERWTASPRRVGQEGERLVQIDGRCNKDAQAPALLVPLAPLVTKHCPWQPSGPCSAPLRRGDRGDLNAHLRLAIAAAPQARGASSPPAPSAGARSGPEGPAEGCAISGQTSAWTGPPWDTRCTPGVRVGGTTGLAGRCNSSLLDQINFYLRRPCDFENTLRPVPDVGPPCPEVCG